MSSTVQAPVAKCAWCPSKARHAVVTEPEQGVRKGENYRAERRLPACPSCAKRMHANGHVVRRDVTTTIGPT